MSESRHSADAALVRSPAVAEARPSNRYRLELYSLRWLLALVFIPALWNPDVAWWVSVFPAASCLVLLVAMGGPMRTNLWAWVIVVVLLWGCWLKAYWLGAVVDDTPFVTSFNPELLRFSRQDVLDAMSWAAIASTVFFLVASVLVRLGAPTARLGALPGPAVAAGRIVGVGVTAFLVGVGASLIQVVLGFGVMGLEPAALPFRLGTLIIRTRMDIVPAVLLLCLWHAEERERKHLSGLVLAAILVLALLDSVIRSSRGALVYYMVPPVFLWLTSGRFAGVRRAAPAALALGTVALYPLLSWLRSLQISMEAGLLAALQALPASLAALDWVASYRTAFVSIFARLMGIDGIMHSLSVVGRSPWDAHGQLAGILATGGVVSYFTTDVVGVAIPNDFRTPGLVGAFMLLGGLEGVVTLTTLLAVVTWALWSACARLQIAPVAQALLTGTLLFFAGEGTMQLQPVVALCVVILIVALTDRWVMRHRPA